MLKNAKKFLGFSPCDYHFVVRIFDAEVGILDGVFDGVILSAHAAFVARGCRARRRLAPEGFDLDNSGGDGSGHTRMCVLYVFVEEGALCSHRLCTSGALRHERRKSRIDF